MIEICDAVALEIEAHDPSNAVPLLTAHPVTDYGDYHPDSAPPFDRILEGIGGWILWQPDACTLTSDAGAWGLQDGRVWRITADGGAPATAYSDTRHRGHGLTPGRTAQLSATVAGDAGEVRVGLVFRDEGGAIIKSVYTPYATPATPTRVALRTLVPDGFDRVTPYLQVRATGGGDAAAGQTLQWDDVSLVADDGPTGVLEHDYAFGTIYQARNLIANPNGAGGAWGWHTNGSVAALTAGAYGPGGDHCMRLWHTVGGRKLISAYTHVELVREYVAGRVDVAAPAGHTLYARLGVELIRGDFGTSVWDAEVVNSWRWDWQQIGNHWTRLTQGGLTGAADPDLYWRFVIDLAADASAAGDLPAGAALLFRGAQLLESTATSGVDNYPEPMATAARGGSLLIVEPPARNLISDAAEVEVHREELNVGTLSARVPGATFDPTVNADARVARRVRVIANTDAGPVPLFTGHVSKLDVTYDADGRRMVQLEALDAVQRLANLAFPRGVSIIDHLPQIMTHLHVPYLIDGDAAYQVRKYEEAFYLDGASLLDQVVIARDTSGGYAWVDGAGVLQLYNAAAMPAVPVVAFSDMHAPGDPDHQCYLPGDGLAAASSEDVVNALALTRLQIDTVSGETVELTEHYRDSASIAQWGRREVQLRVAADQADGEAIAEDVFARNAQLAPRPDTVSFPVRDAGELRRAAALDLMAPVAFAYTPAGLETVVRVAGIRHHLEASRSARGRWLVDVDMRSSDGVAQGRSTPAAASGRASTEWQPLQLLNGWEAWGSPFGEPAIRRDAAGRVYLRGLLRGQAGGASTTDNTIASIPEGYRPAHQLMIPSILNSAPATNAVACRLDVRADGTVALVNSSHVDARFVPLDGLSWFTDQ